MKNSNRKQIARAIFFLLMIFVLSTMLNAQEYKHVGSGSHHYGFDFSIDPSADYYSNWELNSYGNLDFRWRWNLSYGQLGGWRQALAGADFLIVHFKPYDLRAGLKIGGDNTNSGHFAAVGYFRNDLTIFHWKTSKPDPDQCGRPKYQSISLVFYLNAVHNGRHDNADYTRIKRLGYLEPRAGISLNL